MPLLEARGLRKRFGDFAAVDGLDLTVEPGEIFGLIGPDGAGKSTAMRLLVGVLDADEGRVALDGMDVVKHPDQAREKLGYMPQQYSLYADLTVEENLRFFADMYFVPAPARQERLARLYEFSRLAPYARRPAGKLSGGMYKKLALSCNMIHTPKLLLLDEPTTGVDPLSRRELWDILYRFAAEGVGIVVSTPYMDEAERCHRVGLIHNGKFLSVDRPQAILSHFTGELVEVITEQEKAARQLLAHLEGVRRCYPAGAALKVLFAGVGGGEETTRRALMSAAVPFTAVQHVPPSFEDVFLSLMEQRP